MKKLSSILILFMAVASLCVTAHADVYTDDTVIVKNYTDLTHYLASSYTKAQLAPEGDFGWPAKKTTVKLTKDLTGYNVPTWIIPSNITLLQSKEQNLTGVNIQLQGTLTSYGRNIRSPITVQSGGKLILDRNAVMRIYCPIKLKNGSEMTYAGGLDLYSDTGIHGGLIVKKGAKITPKTAGTAIMVFDGCVLESNGATLPNINFMNNGTKITVRGSMTLGNVNIYGSGPIVFEKNAKVKIAGNYAGLNGIAFSKSVPKVTLQEGAALSSTNGFSIDCVNLVMQAKSSITSGGNVVIEKSTVKMSGGSSVISAKGSIALKDKTCAITGSGSLYIGKNGYVADPYKAVGKGIAVVRK